MNIGKLQIEVLKALVSQNRNCSYADGDGVYLFCDNGYRAFSVPKNQCYIDVLKMRRMPKLAELFQVLDSDKEISTTKARYSTVSGIVMKLKCADFSVYVNQSFISPFLGSFKFICSSETSPVKCVNEVTGTVDAIVLPIRFSEEAFC